jgi:hypothetical protein
MPSMLLIFRKCLGSLVNTEKLGAIWIGASATFRHNSCGLKWTKGVTCLGIYISNDIQVMKNVNL